MVQPSKIEMNPKGELCIDWRDGTTSVFAPFALRLACMCAACVDERTGKRMLDIKKIPLDISIRDFETVGRYAVSPRFSDGHNTGIFSFDRLRKLNENQLISESSISFEV